MIVKSLTRQPDVWAHSGQSLAFSKVFLIYYRLNHIFTTENMIFLIGPKVKIWKIWQIHSGFWSSAFYFHVHTVRGWFGLKSVAINFKCYHEVLFSVLHFYELFFVMQWKSRATNTLSRKDDNMNSVSLSSFSDLLLSKVSWHKGTPDVVEEPPTTHIRVASLLCFHHGHYFHITGHVIRVPAGSKKY